MPQTGGLHDLHFSQFWGLEVPDQVPAGLFPGEASLPGLQTATFLLFPHTGERLTSFSSSYEDACPVGSGSHPMTSFNVNHFHKGPLSKYGHIGVWDLNMGRGGADTSVRHRLILPRAAVGGQRDFRWGLYDLQSSQDDCFQCCL